MRAHDNGSLYSCSVSARDVAAFNARWPCSPIPERAHWFQWDKRNGDLVDMTPDTTAWDGTALLALIDDAQDYAELRLDIVTARTLMKAEYASKYS